MKTLEMIDALATRIVNLMHGTAKYEKWIGKWVVIRANMSGVHYAKLAWVHGPNVGLENARRIWSWSGANTITELCLYGAARDSKISAVLSEQIVFDICEINPLDDASRAVLDKITW